jgi:hypothetical protein
MTSASRASSWPFAHGATVSVSGSQLDYLAAPGEVNNVTVSLGGGVYRISDSGALITAPGGCTQVDPRTVTCPAEGISSLGIDVGMGTTPPPMTARRPR